jgi:hypothetical protein
VIELRRIARVLFGVGLVLTLNSCARYPSTGGGTSQARLLFSMTLDGDIRTGFEPGAGGTPFVYMVALRLSTSDNPTDQGPIPIIAQPWGNGFVAGNATHFVWWDPTQSSSQYTLYKFQDATLQQWFATGIPVNVDLIGTGERVLRFELDLAQLEPDPLARDLLRSVQVNFLTMDRIPQVGTTKAWEALGDGRLPSEVNQWITIPLRNSGIYTNQRSGEIEPRGDQPDPSLDLTDWSVEVSLR